MAGVQEGEGEATANPLMEAVVDMVVAEQEVMEAAPVAATMDKSFNQCYIALANCFGVIIYFRNYLYESWKCTSAVVICEALCIFLINVSNMSCFAM